jgi:GntR family transcriptional regulator, rspAB operon transcriptional repressor
MKSASQLEKISDLHLLKDKVYDILKHGIISLAFLPRTQLVEQRLAEDLGVSKSPIRESLLRLERDGLVYTLPFKGCFVAEISAQNIRETFQLREALETYAVRQACKSPPAGGIEQIKKILSRGDEAVRRKNHPRCYQVNIQFHYHLISLGQNHQMIRTYATLRDHLDRYRNLASRILGRVAKSHAEHLKILECLEGKQPIPAQERMAEHLSSVLEDLLHSKEFQRFAPEGGRRPETCGRN